MAQVSDLFARADENPLSAGAGNGTMCNRLFWVDQINGFVLAQHPTQPVRMVRMY